MGHKIKCTIELDVPDELAAGLIALGVGTKEPAGDDAEEAPAPKPRAAAKPAARPAPAPAKKPAKAKDDEDDNDGGFGGGEEAGDVVTLEDVRVAMQRLAQHDSKAAALEMLKDEFGTNNINKLTEDQYPQVVEKCDELIAA